MRLKLQHSLFIANKISIDMLASKNITFEQGAEKVVEAIDKILIEDIKKELAIEEKVRLILDANSDEIENIRADEKQLFFMAKKRIAEESNFHINMEDRFNVLSHKMLDELLNNDLIDFSISENMARNVIFKGMISYMKSYDELEDAVNEKLKHYKRQIIKGTEDYDIMFEKLYTEELKKIGFA